MYVSSNEATPRQDNFLIIFNIFSRLSKIKKKRDSTGNTYFYNLSYFQTSNIGIKIKN